MGNILVEYATIYKVKKEENKKGGHMALFPECYDQSEYAVQYP